MGTGSGDGNGVYLVYARVAIPALREGDSKQVADAVMEGFRDNAAYGFGVLINKGEVVVKCVIAAGDAKRAVACGAVVIEAALSRARWMLGEAISSLRCEVKTLVQGGHPGRAITAVAVP